MRAAILVLVLSLFIGLVAGDWNILRYLLKGENSINGNNTENSNGDNSIGYSVKQYCESWRMNVEVNNIRGFKAVPGECVGYIYNYMVSVQYKVDVQRAAEEIILFLTDNFRLGGDEMDAWIFDIDDVLLSTVPFYKKYRVGASVRCKALTKGNNTYLEAWMKAANAPAIDHMLHLFHLIRARGLKVFILSSRPDYLREATVENLVNVGYHGWADLVLRCSEEENASAEKYKEEQRRAWVEQGYRLWGIVGSQWSSLGGHTTAKRIFKLPNPMYYVY